MSAAPIVRPASSGTRGRLAVGPDVELAWGCYGDAGPDLVTVNNFFMEATLWHSVTSNLESSCQILSYDLRNQGASDRSVSRPTWDDHLSDLLCLLDDREVERTYLLGTSVSTLLCRDFTLRHPERVHGLILAGPALSPWGKDRHHRIISSWVATLDHQGMAALFAQFYPLVFGDHLAESLGTLGYAGRKMSFMAHNAPDELRAALELSLTADADPRLLSGIDCPTLLLVGDDDFALGASGAQEMADMMPDGRLVMIPRSGHLPFVDATERFEAEVAAFVADVACAHS